MKANPETSGGTKTCCRCGESKALDRFGNSKRSPCNKGLGHFRDDTARLAKAIAYLER